MNKNSGITCARGLPLVSAQAKVTGGINPWKCVFSIIMAAGWPIWPLLLASIVAVALIIERLVALRRTKVLPSGLLQRVVAEYRKQGVSETMLTNLEAQSPLGAYFRPVCAMSAVRAKSCAMRSRNRRRGGART